MSCFETHGDPLFVLVTVLIGSFPCKIHSLWYLCYVRGPGDCCGWYLLAVVSRIIFVRWLWWAYNRVPRSPTRTDQWVFKTVRPTGTSMHWNAQLIWQHELALSQPLKLQRSKDIHVEQNWAQVAWQCPAWREFANMAALSTTKMPHTTA